MSLLQSGFGWALTSVQDCMYEMCLSEQVRHFSSSWQQIPPCKSISSKAQGRRGGRASPQHRYVPVSAPLRDQSVLCSPLVSEPTSPQHLKKGISGCSEAKLGSEGPQVRSSRLASSSFPVGTEVKWCWCFTLPVQCRSLKWAGTNCL